MASLIWRKAKEIEKGRITDPHNRAGHTDRPEGFLMRKPVVAVLALLISSGAFADEAYLKGTPDQMLKSAPFSPFQRALWAHVQLRAMQNVAWVEVATTDGRCSSAFRADPAALRAVLGAGAVVPPSGDQTLSDLRDLFADYYLHNKAVFCDYAREQFGPNGKQVDEFQNNSRPMLNLVAP